jgi:hypothetical protein
MTTYLAFQFCVVQLVDAHHCTDAGKYVSVVLMALQTMIHMELPQVNILSKVDLVEAYGRFPRRLEYYTEVQDLDEVVLELNAHPILKKYGKLNRAIADVIEDYSLVSFVPMAIDDPPSVACVVALVDKAVGYMYGQAVNDVDTREALRETYDRYNTIQSLEERLEQNSMTDLDMDKLPELQLHRQWLNFQEQSLRSTSESKTPRGYSVPPIKEHQQ